MYWSTGLLTTQLEVIVAIQEAVLSFDITVIELLSVYNCEQGKGRLGRHDYGSTVRENKVCNGTFQRSTQLRQPFPYSLWRKGSFAFLCQERLTVCIRVDFLLAC